MFPTRKYRCMWITLVLSAIYRVLFATIILTEAYRTDEYFLKVV